MEEILRLIYPMESTFFWSLIIFLIFSFLLWKFVFPKVTKIIKEREKKIQNRIDEAERTKEEAANLLDEYKEKIKKAEKEAHEIREKAKKDGQRLKKEAIEETRKEIKDLLSLAQHQIEIEKNRTVSEIKNYISEMVIAVSEKVIKKSLDKEDHLRLIEESIAEITREKI